jgi:hypothetical protein
MATGSYCPHLWKAMWSEENSLQIGVYLPTATLLVTLGGRCYARNSFP